METVFSYLATLDTAELVIYFCLFSVILAVFPFSEIIIKYLKHFVSPTELEVVYFNYHTQKNDCKAQTTELKLPQGAQNVLINGRIINFIWKVKGAKKIDLLPIGENLKGNASADIINGNKKKYTLVAHGFNGQKVESVVDLSQEIFYSIKTNPLASNQKIIRTAPKIGSTKFSNSKPLNFKLTETKSHKLISWLNINFYDRKTKKINIERFIKMSPEKINLTNSISSGKIVKSYTFSTKKYQSLN